MFLGWLDASQASLGGRVQQAEGQHRGVDGHVRKEEPRRGAHKTLQCRDTRGPVRVKQLLEHGQVEDPGYTGCSHADKHTPVMPGGGGGGGS